jgi:hypothetical protein
MQLFSAATNLQGSYCEQGVQTTRNDPSEFRFSFRLRDSGRKPGRAMRMMMDLYDLDAGRRAAQRADHLYGYQWWRWNSVRNCFSQAPKLGPG